MSTFVPTWEQPSHADRLKVVKGAAPYESSARSLVALPAGAVFAKITTAEPAAYKTYTSVQTGQNSNIELCSDLVYCNHSCAPSLEFDMARFEVRVSRHQPLAIGDELTFYYPSTEWDMVQPFSCTCGSERCLKVIAGARDFEPRVLERYWLNPHIEELLAAHQATVGEKVDQKPVETSAQVAQTALLNC